MAETARQTVSYLSAPHVVCDGKFCIGREAFGECLDELSELHRTHWEETETQYLTVPLNPDYERFIAVDQVDRLALLTARTSSGVLVGCVMYFLNPFMHSMEYIIAQEDQFFVHPEYRGTGLADALVEQAHEYLRNRGVQLVGMSDKSPVGGKSLKTLMQRQGYTHAAEWYIREL